MIIREKHSATTGYCIISRQLAQETILSPGAKTLLIYMLSFPDSWEHTIDSLAKGRNESQEDIVKYLSELAHYGYYHIDFIADLDGNKIPIRQVISEYPIRRKTA